jgi:hypothetical protein
MYYMLYHEETLHIAQTMCVHCAGFLLMFHESLKTSSDYFFNVVNRPSFKMKTIPVL